MKKISLTLLSIFFISVFSIHAEYFRKIGLDEGLTQPSVMSICQDKLGRMWFGTREGINVYDGDRVIPYKGWVKSGTSMVWLGNIVTEIDTDKSGDVYFVSDYNLMKYEMETQQFHRLFDDAKTQSLASYEGEIWFMRRDSIYSINPETKELHFQTYVKSTGRVNDMLITSTKIYVGSSTSLAVVNRSTQECLRVMEGNDVQYLFYSSEHELWIGTRMDGLYWMGDNNDLYRVPFSSDGSKGIRSTQIRQFVEDDQHNVWFGTFDGLYKYDVRAREYKLIKIPEKVGGLTHSSVYSLYKDKQGIIWVGTYWGGVNYFDPVTSNYVFYEYGIDETKDLYFSYIGSMLLDKDDNLWLCTDGGGVSCMNDQWEVVHRFTSGMPNSLLHNNVKGIAYDEANDCMYIATYLGGLSRYDMRTHKFFNYLTDYHKEGPKPGNIVNYIKIRDDKLYMLTDKTFYILDIPTQKFQEVKIPADYRLGFDVDKNNNLYLIGWYSFGCLNLDHPEHVVRVSLREKGCKSILTNVLVRNDVVILSSLGTGVFMYNTKTHGITQYTEKDGYIPSDYCYNICLTHEDNILVSTDKGVTYYNPRIDKFSTIDFNHFFPNTHIIKDCGLFTSKDGTVFVGGTKGLVTFKQREFHKVREQSEIPNFYFSSLTVENENILPGDETDILKLSMAYTSSINLKHHQNNVKIGYAVSDYEQNLAEKSFMYRLTGLHNGWVHTGESSIQFNNLAPGNYTLHVALMNYDKIIKEIKMDIHIASPWYNTWIAWIVYILILIAVSRFLVKNRIAKRTLALRLENERREKEHIEQLNQEKLVFFTNVSHEFRTPLTLLISHVDLLLQKHTFSPTIYNQILKVRKNAEQMNFLITELLEFRKLTQNHRKLQVMRHDMCAFLKESFIPFIDYANQRHITYENNFPSGPVVCMFDDKLLNKVIFNLLSNAFKFTPDGGKITISGKVTSEEVEFTVSDTGVGLSEKDVSNIFVRFYQGENQQKNNVNSPGTGIGLALCKAIVEKHHGDISVESVVGEGSSFTVKLKCSLEAFRDDDQIEIIDTMHEPSYILDDVPEMKEQVSLPETSAGEEQAEEDPVEEPVEKEQKNYTVLLVEDNVELLQILGDLFSPFYQVLMATNGEEGLQKVYEQKIDLIVSDIMMPKMSGTEMCLQLKNNIDYCHIPIILLTALDSTEQNIEGLSRGADDYVTKPFHAGLLLARANNLIRSRLLMQHQFDKRPMSEIDLTTINPLDQELLKKVTDIIEAHIDDPLFDIPLLCKELGVSRSLIYAKFKALTGMTPNNFILNFRLKFAATLLKQYKDMPISEVSDRSGFNSPVYFSQCFKKQFGVTPHNYKRENTNKD